MQYAEVARARSDRGEIVLRRHQDEDGPAVFELRVNGVFVMDTVETSSEVALARAALDRADHRRSVLVGGLGLGFTAHEVLADGRVEELVVAEIEDALVEWFRDGTVPHGPAYLADERLTVTVGDIQQVVAEAMPESFDLILLDVDNGPDFLVFEGNALIYESLFLQQVEAALCPGGTLAIWSSTRSEKLAKAMSATFEEAGIEPCPVTLQGRDETYWLHTAHKSHRQSE